MARPRRGLLSPSLIARRNAISRGLLGGSRAWLIVGSVFWAGRLARRVLGRTEEIAAVERLAPGQRVTIEAIKPMSRRDRRASRSS